ncbi:type II toxin-antitoxin system Phd/YefM family antitoxin [Cellulomonas sp. Sa3CUA2]|uniref:Antitoxin n=1 Tax=Cellulomonas avistercoris TaxID=2762242 RepID=A0ABR8QDY1_9CELL|nr:type II toxin-antitoxin system Phd/YefM family antitoxin [Cellulomonas avistercoris]MBD7918638.1 type II toxin-antitoxin system Phd/YefM family antitoxin [Cellulomonas avistercoris]
MTTTSLANVKAHLSRYVDSVQDTHERVTITRNGEPAAVLMSPDDLASLEETIAVLSDRETMEEVHEADAAVAAGDVTPLAEVLRRLREGA